MTRFSEEAVKNCAKSAIARFRATWTCFGDEIRDALLDSSIMDSVRWADSADSTFSFTASELIDFRARVVEVLAAGVFVGKTKHGLTFDRDREERREKAAYDRGIEDGKETP